jgi:hypothetical protein
VGNRCCDDDDDDDDDFVCSLSGKKGSTQAGQVLKDSKSFRCCMMEFDNIALDRLCTLVGALSFRWSLFAWNASCFEASFVLL